MPAVIALDVGGSAVKSGAVLPGGRLLEGVLVTAVDSAGSAETILEALAEIIERQLRQLGSSQEALQGVAIAFPGPFDYQQGVSYIRALAKYESLYGLNVRGALQARLSASCPIRFCNDAEAAIVGECCYGAGRGYARVIGVTLGTGFGSAFVIGGVPQEQGMGIPARGWLYPERFMGQRADDLFSVRGLKRRLHGAGVHVSDTLQAAALGQQGSLEATRVFEAFGHDMGRFLTPFAEAFQAELVLVLGGIAGSFELFAEPLSCALPVPARSGVLGAKAALLGVAARFSASC